MATQEKIKQVEIYLSQVHKINSELDTLLGEANMMHKLAAECDGANAKSAAIIIRRYAKKINYKVNEYLKVLEQVKNAIDKINDADCSALLVKRYLQNKTWEQIAEEMSFSTAHIYRLRKKALEMAGKMIP